jgi:hypothetical protein
LFVAWIYFPVKIFFCSNYDVSVNPPSIHLPCAKDVLLQACGWAAKSERWFCLRERTKGAAECFGVTGGDELIDFVVCGLPDGKRTGEEVAAFGGEDEDAAAAVGRIGRYLDQAAALKWLEGGGKRGAIHGEQRGDRAHGRRVGAIERHEERELAVGEIEGAECLIETTGEGAGGALDVKAEAAIAN